MPKTAAISARIDPELKQNAEEIFTELGLTASQAITLFYKQVQFQNGLPFQVNLPNISVSIPCGDETAVFTGGRTVNKITWLRQPIDFLPRGRLPNGQRAILRFTVDVARGSEG